MNRRHSISAGALFVLATAAAAQTTPTSPQTGIPALVTEARVNVRKGPGSDFERFTLLDEGATVAVIEKQGNWSKIRMGDGRTGWIGAQYLRRDPAAPSASAPSNSNSTSASTSNSNSTSDTEHRTPDTGHRTPTSPSGTRTSSSPSPSSKTAAPTVPTTQPPNDPTTPVSALLVDTKKDPFASGSGIGVGVGDAFRLLLYLLPVLGLVVLAVRALKRFQEKTGTLPSLGGSMLGGFNLANSRKTGGSNIRVVESLPVGRMELSLVEVRGRLLLVACSGGGVTLLTELKSGAEAESEFQTLLGAYAEDDPEDLDGTIGATVGSLDDSLRETREAIVRTAQRTLRKTGSGRRVQDIDREWRS